MSILVLAVTHALLAAVVVAAQRRMAFEPPAAGPVVLYVMATLGMFACYGRALWQARATAAGARARGLLGAPLVVWIALTPTLPTLSIDVFSYLAHGHQVNTGVNPYTTPTSVVGHEQYGRQLERLGWLPVHPVSPYGPLWTRFEALAHASSPRVERQVVWMKVAATASGLACALLIWQILGVIARPWRLFGTVMFLWNPLVVFELAGEGHNDAVMLALTLVGLLLFVRGHHPAAAAAVAAATLVKITALVVAAPLARHVLLHGARDRPTGARPTVIARSSLAVLLVAAVGWLLYGAFWAGLATFDGVRQAATAHVAPSTAGTLYWYFVRAYPEAASAGAVTLLLQSVLVVAAVAISIRARTVDATLAACGALSLVVLLTAASYWPWYVVTPVALLALASQAPLAVPTAVAFSLAGRLVAPLERLRLNGLTDWPTATVLATLVGLWLPALIVMALMIRHPRRPGPTGDPSPNRTWQPAANAH